jgi:hypothetical protein
MKSICSVLLLQAAGFIATDAFISLAPIHDQQPYSARLSALRATRSKSAKAPSVGVVDGARSKTRKAPVAPQTDSVDILAFGLTAGEFEAAKAAFSSTLNMVQPRLDSEFADTLSDSSGEKIVVEHSAEASRPPRCLLVLNRTVKTAALAAARAALDDSIEHVILVKPTQVRMKQWKSKKLQMSDVWSAAVAHYLQENELVVPVDIATSSFDPLTVRTLF